MLTDVSSVESTLQVGRTDSRKDLSTQAGVKDHPQDGVILQENWLLGFSATGTVVYGHLHFLYYEDACLQMAELRALRY
jgi:hypothetical protein